MSAATIQSVHARWVLDSRGTPTVHTTLRTQNGTYQATIPSGASTGTHEAVELRDGGKAFWGKGVKKAVGNVHTVLAKQVKGALVSKQAALDASMNKLDGTPNKGRLGANAILSISLAASRAAAAEQGIPLYEYLGRLNKTKTMCLPTPLCNVINGGVHAGNGLAFQEYMLAPVKFKRYSEGLTAVCETYQQIKMLLKEKYGKGATNVGDEGGFAPPLSVVEEPLKIMEKAVENAGYTGKIRFALDLAASEFQQGQNYVVDSKTLTTRELEEKLLGLAGDYDIASIEDPFGQEDFAGFTALTRDIGARVQVVTDDLTVTNTQRMKIALSKKAGNALLLKVNQIGTLTESLAAHQLANKNHWNTVVSHRSGETTDAYIADLAVGIGCGQIKTGAPARGERTAKYNRLLEIEDELGNKAKYPGTFIY